MLGCLFLLLGLTGGIFSRLWIRRLFLLAFVRTLSKSSSELELQLLCKVYVLPFHFRFKKENMSISERRVIRTKAIFTVHSFTLHTIKIEACAQRLWVEQIRRYFQCVKMSSVQTRFSSPSCTMYCPHCKKDVTIKTYRKHRRLYFCDDSWIVSVENHEETQGIDSIERGEIRILSFARKFVIQ